MMVADSLKAVISQSLLPRRDGPGRVAAFEILRNTPAVGGLIRDAKTFQIPTAIQTGAGVGHAAHGRGPAAAGPGGHHRAARGLGPRAAQGRLRAVPGGGRGARRERRRAPPRRRRLDTKTKQVGEVDVLSVGTNRIDRFLAILPKRNGSDLHLSVGSPPVVRIDGELERMRYRVLTEGDFFNLVGPITPPRIWEAYRETGDVDFAYQMGKQARFRVNLFRQERGSAAVFRLIPSRVPTAEDLEPAGADRRPLRGPARPDPRHRSDRQRQVDQPGGDPRPHEQAARAPRRDDRRPHRVRPHQRQVGLHAARDRPGRPELRRGREGGDPRGPRLSARRRDAGSRDDAHGADGGARPACSSSPRSTRTPRPRPSTASSTPSPRPSRSRCASSSPRSCAASSPSSSSARKAAGGCRPSRSSSARARSPTRSARARPP